MGGLKQPQLASNIRKALTDRLDAIERLLGAVAREQRPSAREIHSLRVASRRVQAAVRVCEPLLRKGEAKRLRSAMRLVRHAAAPLRACDVDLAFFAKAFEDAGANSIHDSIRVAYVYCVGRLDAERTAFADQLRHAATKEMLRDVRKAGRSAQSRLETSRKGTDVETLNGALCDAVEHGVEKVEHPFASTNERAASDTVHAARIAIKQLRYSIDFVGESCGASAAFQPVRKQLAALQDNLGDVNDADERLRHIASWIDDAGAPGTTALPTTLREGLDMLQRDLAQQHDDAQQAALSAWPTIAHDRLASVCSDARRLASDMRACRLCVDHPSGADALIDANPSRSDDRQAQASDALRAEIGSHGRR